MFYVIERDYVGPNRVQHPDSHEVLISTKPATYNGSGEPCNRGWCGTTNDTAVHAHYGYDTIEEADDAIIELFGAVRAGNEFEDFIASYEHEAHIVAAYRVGSYEPMSPRATVEWAADWLYTDVHHGTTDAEIEALLDECDLAANQHGCAIDRGALEGAILARRRELIEENEQDQEHEK